MEAEVLPASESTVRTPERHGECWGTFIAGGGRHHALAEPSDVEAYAGHLLSRNSGTTAGRYFRGLRSFYGWFLTSTEHPHVYSPVLMAADAGGDAGRL